MLSTVLAVVFLFALAAALTPTEKLWRRIVGGVIAALLAGALLYNLFVHGFH